MSEKNNNEKTLIGKAKQIKKILKLAELKMDSLIAVLSDPKVLHDEFKRTKTDYEKKLDKVLDLLIEIEEKK